MSITSQSIIAYIRRQIRGGHSPLMALDMAANKFQLSASYVTVLASVMS